MIRSRMLVFTGALVCASSVWAQSATPTPPPSTPVDNTKINTRDRAPGAMTPTSQSTDASDRDVSAAVRRAVMREKGLSTSAHNVKIMAKNGEITLRGPVQSADEKDKVAALAQQTAGVTGVQNELEVKSK